MSSNIFKQKISLLQKKTNFKTISRNYNLNLDINKTLINTRKAIKRNKTTLSIKNTSPFHCFHTKNISVIKSKNKYNIDKNEKYLNQIKIFDEINNFDNLNKNFDKINFKTLEHYNNNNNNNKRRRTLKKYNSFNGFKKGKIHIFNKEPLPLKSELFNFDKKFFREISPINNFINLNKKVNENKKKYIENNKDNFYFNINSTRDKNDKTKNLTFKYYNSNKKFFYPKNNNKKYVF